MLPMSILFLIVVLSISGVLQLIRLADEVS